MRILISCLQDLRLHSIPAYRFWRGYFKSGIEEAGHEAVEVPDVDWAEGCTNLTPEERRAWLDRTWSQTIETIRYSESAGRGPDLFLSYLYPQQIEANAIAEIRRLGVPCVNFFCDNIREFTQVPTEFHFFDLHWVPEFEALPMYQNAGLKTCFAPMPCWVLPEARKPLASENGQITFIGSCDELRGALLSKALSLGASIKIGGAGWSETSRGSARRRSNRSLTQIVRNQVESLKSRGLTQWMRKVIRRMLPEPECDIPSAAILPLISDSDYVRLTKEGLITLGINRVPTFQRSRVNPLRYSRLRDIEAPMMGACYLTEWTEGLSHLYEVGKEIEVYRNAEEMVAKISELKSDKKKRFGLRTAGQHRALNELSVGRSLKKITEALGLQYP